MVATPASALSFERAPSAATARRARSARPSESAELGDALARGPMDDRRREALHLEPIAERGERADDIVVERHMGERPVVLSCEIEVRQAHGVAHVPVHDRHREDGLRLGFDRLPGADALDEAPRPFGDCDRAQGRRARAGRRRRIDERD